MAKQVKIVQDTTQGAALGGPIGAALGFVNSAWEQHAQMSADRKSRQFTEQQAKKQFDRQKYFDSLEKRWNSEQAQVQRFKDAGLNPNLLYGDLSASTVSTPTPPLPSTPNGVTRDFSVDSSALQGAQTGIDSLLKASQIDNLNQNTAQQFQDTLGKDIENRYKETGIIQTLTEQIERINKLRADIEKTGADTKTVDALRDNLIEQLNQEIELLKQKQLDSQQGRKESEQRIDESKQNIKKSIQDVKESKQRIDESKQRIDESIQNINESKSREKLNNSNRIFKDVETKDLVRQYSLNIDQYRMIHDYVKEHNLPEGSEKSIIDALNNFAESTGKTIPEMTGKIVSDWLSASTWLNYLASEHRTDAIQNGNNESADGTYTPPSNHSTSEPNDPTSRNNKEFEEEFDRSYTPNQKRYILVARQKWQYLSPQKRQEFENWSRKYPYSTQYERAAQVQKLYYQQYGKNTLPDDN